MINASNHMPAQRKHYTSDVNTQMVKSCLYFLYCDHEWTSKKTPQK